MRHTHTWPFHEIHSTFLRFDIILQTYRTKTSAFSSNLPKHRLPISLKIRRLQPRYVSYLSLKCIKMHSLFSSIFHKHNPQNVLIGHVIKSYKQLHVGDSFILVSESEAYLHIQQVKSVQPLVCQKRSFAWYI